MFVLGDHILLENPGDRVSLTAEGDATWTMISRLCMSIGEITHTATASSSFAFILMLLVSFGQN